MFSLRKFIIAFWSGGKIYIEKEKLSRQAFITLLVLVIQYLQSCGLIISLASARVCVCCVSRYVGSIR